VFCLDFKGFLPSSAHFNDAIRTRTLRTDLMALDSFWIYLLIGFYVLVVFLSVLVIPVCGRY